MDQERQRIIAIFQKFGLLCTSEQEVCNLSRDNHGCSCGEIYKEIWEN